MRRFIRMIAVLFVASLLLGGCAMRTVEELYCLPKRSQTDNDLLTVIDEAMDGLEYCAPQSGENRPAVQMADLDGDGVNECLLFARDNSDKPLKILIFCQLASGYVLMDTIEGYGFGYDFVTYRQVDDRPGVEIIVGRLVSEEVVRSVSVYRFASGISRHLLSTGYSRMTTADLDGDGMCELFLLNQGTSETENGSVTLYSYRNAELQRSAETTISNSAAGYKQILAGQLSDSTMAVYVTCAGDSVLVTDIFTAQSGQLSKVAYGIETATLHNYYVYPADMDDDDVLEIPRLVPMQTQTDSKQYLIEWYAVDAQGRETIKQYTYHNYADNWYITVDNSHKDMLSVERSSDVCKFYMYDPVKNGTELLLTVAALADADREELAQQPGRVVLYSGDSVIYVADLGEAAEKYGITAENLLTRFKPIRIDLNTQED